MGLSGGAGELYSIWERWMDGGMKDGGVCVFSQIESFSSNYPN